MKNQKPTTTMKQYLKRMDRLALDLIDVCNDIHNLGSELTEEEKKIVAKQFRKDMGDDYSVVNLALYGRNFDDADDMVNEIFNTVE